MEQPVFAPAEAPREASRTQSLITLIGGLVLITLLVIFLGLGIFGYINLNSRCNSLSATVERQRQRIAMLQMASFMSEGVVTDDIVIQKAYFFRSGDQLNVDIRPQPSFAYHFQGQGRFDLSDRELKSVLLTLVDQIKKQFEDDSELPSFDSLTISITQNNYEVATYAHGELKLKGE